MNKRIMITGGAGFIGSHLADELLNHGYQVRALDCLSAQVHGEDGQRPAYLHDDVELVVGDVRDAGAVRRALADVDAVVHLAARVGVGQSMYDVAGYTSANNEGTAVLLQALIERPVERLVVASSMSVYGEGLYTNPEGEVVPGRGRSLERLRAHDWQVRDAAGRVLTPIPTTEAKAPDLASVYALSKFDQERMSLLIGKAYNISTVALRFFNVYGPRQALSNPYTGVLAIFAARLLNGRAPLIFEDGYQERDFVSVYDVARACRLALEQGHVTDEVFNIGSGEHYSVREIADRMAYALNKDYIKPEITENYRVGDIRHCFADIASARKCLGYEPRVNLKEGLIELAKWLGGQIAIDRVAEAQAELNLRGLTV